MEELINKASYRDKSKRVSIHGQFKRSSIALLSARHKIACQPCQSRISQVRIYATLCQIYQYSKERSPPRFLMVIFSFQLPPGLSSSFSYEISSPSALTTKMNMVPW